MSDYTVRLAPSKEILRCQALFYSTRMDMAGIHKPPCSRAGPNYPLNHPSTPARGRLACPARTISRRKERNLLGTSGGQLAFHMDTLQPRACCALTAPHHSLTWQFDPSILPVELRRVSHRLTSCVSVLPFRTVLPASKALQTASHYSASRFGQGFAVAVNLADSGCFSLRP